MINRCHTWVHYNIVSEAQTSAEFENKFPFLSGKPKMSICILANATSLLSPEVAKIPRHSRSAWKGMCDLGYILSNIRKNFDVRIIINRKH